MAGVSLITMVTMGFAVVASKPMIRNSEDGYCHIACLENEICHIQYIVKATITGEQGPSIVNPLYSSNNINLDGMSEEERNHTLEMYGDNSYSLNILEVVMSDDLWEGQITNLPLDVAITTLRCGVNLKIGSTYILYGYYRGWLATGNERKALWFDECTPPVEINASDPVPKRFLERNCY